MPKRRVNDHHDPTQAENILSRKKGRLCSLPLARYMHLAVRLFTNILVFGGNYENSDQYYKQGRTGEETTYLSMRRFWAYNIDTECWRRRSARKDEPIPLRVSEACAVTVGGCVYLHGGYRARSHAFLATSAFWRLSLSESGEYHWRKMKFDSTTEVPSARAGHCGWEYLNKLWIFGREGEVSTGTFTPAW